jgi:hypothetical protein
METYKALLDSTDPHEDSWLLNDNVRSIVNLDDGNQEEKIRYELLVKMFVPVLSIITTEEFKALSDRMDNSYHKLPNCYEVGEMYVDTDIEDSTKIPIPDELKKSREEFDEYCKLVGIESNDTKFAKWENMYEEYHIDDISGKFGSYFVSDAMLIYDKFVGDIEAPEDAWKKQFAECSKESSEKDPLLISYIMWNFYTWKRQAKEDVMSDHGKYDMKGDSDTYITFATKIREILGVFRDECMGALEVASGYGSTSGEFERTLKVLRCYLATRVQCAMHFGLFKCRFDAYLFLAVISQAWDIFTTVYLNLSSIDYAEYFYSQIDDMTTPSQWFNYTFALQDFEIAFDKMLNGSNNVILKYTTEKDDGDDDEDHPLGDHSTRCKYANVLAVSCLYVSTVENGKLVFNPRENTNRDGLYLWMSCVGRAEMDLKVSTHSWLVNHLDRISELHHTIQLQSLQPYMQVSPYYYLTAIIREFEIFSKTYDDKSPFDKNPYTLKDITKGFAEMNKRYYVTLVSVDGFNKYPTTRTHSNVQMKLVASDAEIGKTKSIKTLEKQLAVEVKPDDHNAIQQQKSYRLQHTIEQIEVYLDVSIQDLNLKTHLIMSVLIDHMNNLHRDDPFVLKSIIDGSPVGCSDVVSIMVRAVYDMQKLSITDQNGVRKSLNRWILQCLITCWVGSVIKSFADIEKIKETHTMPEKLFDNYIGFKRELVYWFTRTSNIKWMEMMSGLPWKDKMAKYVYMLSNTMDQLIYTKMIQVLSFEERKTIAIYVAKKLVEFAMAPPERVSKVSDRNRKRINMSEGENVDITKIAPELETVEDPFFVDFMVDCVLATTNDQIDPNDIQTVRRFDRQTEKPVELLDAFNKLRDAMVNVMKYTGIAEGDFKEQVTALSLNFAKQWFTGTKQNLNDALLAFEEQEIGSIQYIDPDLNEHGGDSSEEEPEEEVDYSDIDQSDADDSGEDDEEKQEQDEPIKTDDTTTKAPPGLEPKKGNVRDNNPEVDPMDPDESEDTKDTNKRKQSKTKGGSVYDTLALMKPEGVYQSVKYPIFSGLTRDQRKQYLAFNKSIQKLFGRGFLVDIELHGPGVMRLANGKHEPSELLKVARVPISVGGADYKIVDNGTTNHRIHYSQLTSALVSGKNLNKNTCQYLVRLEKLRKLELVGFTGATDKLRAKNDQLVLKNCDLSIMNMIDLSQVARLEIDNCYVTGNKPVTIDIGGVRTLKLFELADDKVKKLKITDTKKLLQSVVIYNVSTDLFRNMIKANPHIRSVHDLKVRQSN